MKKAIFFIIISFLIVILSSCQNIVYLEENVYAMNTIFDIKLYQGNNDNIKDIKAIILNFNDLFDSENENLLKNNLASLNKTGEEIIVDDNLFKILELSKEYYEISNGYFNVMMKEVNDIWKQGFIDNIIPHLNKEDYIYNIENISLNQTENKVKFLNNTKVDLGGIAKGYTINTIKQYLKENEITKYCISAGTSSILLGTFQDGKEFNLSIKHPDNGFIDSFNLLNTSVSTSGNYNQYIEKDGRKYHHIINPFTLMSENYFQSITVFHDDGILADVFSTFLFNIKKEDHINFISKIDSIKLLYLEIDGNVTKWGF